MHATPVVTRIFTGDRLPHLYLVAEVDDPAVEDLIPPGHDGWYPERHPRVELSEHDAPAPASLVDCCPQCARWARENPHRVLIRGEVFSW